MSPNSKYKQDYNRPQEDQLEERVIVVDRVSRTVAGGRRLRFRAVVALGDKKGKVGVALAKAKDVASAIDKARRAANKKLLTIPLKNGTIPHPIIWKSGASKILLRPAKAGSTVKAGGPVRAILELAGVTDVTTKVLGSNNKINNALATLEALRALASQTQGND